MLKARDRWPIAVCSWSLKATPDELVEIIAKLGSPMVHLAISDLVDAPATAADLAKELSISATMVGFPQEDYTTLETIKATGGIVPDECWEQNLKHVTDGIELTASLEAPFMTFHAGFIDESNPAIFQKVSERLKTIGDIAKSNGIMVLMETGQETAADLASFIHKLQHPAIGINFDPANMILYGKGNPQEAIRELSQWVKHIHIKDAVKAATPGEWGAEVAWGDGEVGADEFLNTLAEIDFSGTLAVEREAGETRIEDITKAIERLTASR